VGLVEVSQEDITKIKKDVDELRAENDARWMAMLACQENSTKAIKDLTESTQGIVDLYSDLQGAARVGIAVQRGAIYLTKFGVAGTMAAGALMYIVHEFSP
jgi:hypothetical protein